MVRTLVFQTGECGFESRQRYKIRVDMQVVKADRL